VINGLPQNEFEKAAREKPPGLVRELFGLLKANKKWWLAPIILALLAIGALVILAATKAAPFIYPLF
jgi:hypothetical protein